MIRPLRPLIAIVALAGCQQPGPATDPFLYRSTIPPPGTAMSSAPLVTPGPQPYYSNAPTAVPGPSPYTPDTPAPIVQPAPVAPAPAPIVPVMPPRIYPQRGGFDGLQSSNDAPPAPTNVAAVRASLSRVRSRRFELSNRRSNIRPHCQPTAWPMRSSPAGRRRIRRRESFRRRQPRL